MDLSIILVTSPSPTHPSTILVDSVISSLKLFGNVIDSVPIWIIADGVIIVEDGKARSKRGRVMRKQAAAYEEYLCALENKVSDPPFNLVRMERHVGFAMAVKRGLELCGTMHALVLQHDRVFTSRVPEDLLNRCLYAMSKDDSIRYIGFPTINNNQHDNVMVTNGLASANHSPLLRRPLNPVPINSPATQHQSDSPTDELLHQQGISSSIEPKLQPCSFWYDSNFLAHVPRMLEIYKPFSHFPRHLREPLGDKASMLLRDMLLRDGDFIEDRFGQAMRACLAMLLKAPVDTGGGPAAAEAALKWFGCTLLWDASDAEAAAVSAPTFNLTEAQGQSKGRPQGRVLGAGQPRARIFVSHLRGRQRGEGAALSAARTYDIAANSAQGTQDQDKDQEQEQEQEQVQEEEQQNGSDVDININGNGNSNSNSNSASDSDSESESEGDSDGNSEEIPVTAHGSECLCCASETDDKEVQGIWAWEPRQPIR